MVDSSHSSSVVCFSEFSTILEDFKISLSHYFKNSYIDSLILIEKQMWSLTLLHYSPICMEPFIIDEMK